MDSSESDAYALAGLRVIIIEDEAILALCLGEIIEGEGCVVIGTAGTLGDALRLAETTTFDLAIIDLHLDGQQAHDIVASIIRSGRAIIISTGSDASEIPAEFHEWPVLRKPFANAAICAAITSAVAIHSRLGKLRDSLPECTLAL